MMCQRYFRYAGGAAGRATASTTGEVSQMLSPQMRVSPTVALVNGTNAILEPGLAFRNITGVNVANGGTNALILGISGSSGLTTGNVIVIPGSDGISFSAEL
jgi:hypothetical protein